MPLESTSRGILTGYVQLLRYAARRFPFATTIYICEDAASRNRGDYPGIMGVGGYSGINPLPSPACYYVLHD